jgi:hypothetical protein
MYVLLWAYFYRSIIFVWNMNSLITKIKEKCFTMDFFYFYPCCSLLEELSIHYTVYPEDRCVSGTVPTLCFLISQAPMKYK